MGRQRDGTFRNASGQIVTQKEAAEVVERVRAAALWFDGQWAWTVTALNGALGLFSYSPAAIMYNRAHGWGGIIKVEIAQTCSLPESSWAGARTALGLGRSLVGLAFARKVVMVRTGASLTMHGVDPAGRIAEVERERRARREIVEHIKHNSFVVRGKRMWAAPALNEALGHLGYASVSSVQDVAEGVTGGTASVQARLVPEHHRNHARGSNRTQQLITEAGAAHIVLLRLRIDNFSMAETPKQDAEPQTNAPQDTTEDEKMGEQMGMVFKNTSGQSVTQEDAMRIIEKVKALAFSLVVEGKKMLLWAAEPLNDAFGEYAYKGLGAIYGAASATGSYVYLSDDDLEDVPEQYRPDGLGLFRFLTEAGVAEVVRRRLCVEGFSMEALPPQEAEEEARGQTEERPPERLAAALTLAEKVAQRGARIVKREPDEPVTEPLKTTPRDEVEPELVRAARILHDARCHTERAEAQLEAATAEAGAALEEWRAAQKLEREEREAVERLANRDEVPDRPSSLSSALSGVLAAHEAAQAAALEVASAGARVREASEALKLARAEEKRARQAKVDALDRMRSLIG